MENPTKAIPLVYTVKEVSQTLQIGKTLVYRLIRSKKLRSIRVGNKYLVPRDALVDFLNRST